MYRYDYIRDNTVFSIEILSTLEAMKSNLHVNRSYEIYETRQRLVS